MEPLGYRLEWKPCEYVFATPGNFEAEICKSSARVWGLFPEPQDGCHPEVEVYKGWCWVQPKYVYSMSVEGFVPLYLGPLLQDPVR